MGYYSSFNLEIRKRNRVIFTPEEREALTADFNRSAYTWFGYERDTGDAWLHWFDDDSLVDDNCIYFYSKDIMKWYTAEENIGSIAERYPDYVFELYGNGEDADDQWKVYYCGEETQQDRMEWVFGQPPQQWFVKGE